MPHRDHISKQLNRILSSSVLNGSESLCRLLSYLAKHALEHPGVPLKEYQIATEVLGRSGDFDPQLDSVVRVQAGRLRSKLAEYYAGEGAEDQFVIELPKGAYLLSVHQRAADVAAESDSLGQRPRTDGRARQVHRDGLARAVRHPEPGGDRGRGQGGAGAR